MDIFELIKIIPDFKNYDDFAIIPRNGDKFETNEGVIITYTEQKKQDKINISSSFINKNLTKAKENVPYQDIVDLYNEYIKRYNDKTTGKKRSTIQSISGEAKENLRARWTDSSGKYNNIEAWINIINKVENSYFLNSEKSSWFSFRWLIKPNNFSKLNSGDYDDENMTWFIESDKPKEPEVKEEIPEELSDFEKEMLEKIKRANK